ncbi:carbohydrate ABC transporter membrane protein 1, CUT1 family [Paenibacillus uliginis N3/975]|uniref:Carbohydrate ABC transporter membrane protein 1, CUT1 family n=1 Tax=Paenibacillus uliginis N3/975 TaxID=1313296 RepID=A0A1X7HEB7_9BACL|nr:sugar ABC transporter permease [Paenibacillus uliginis]SMF84918.1 carbohydrate ABC transporter membrane protein 1, CUT1 family [Paenibacillus uliginis N3/975]
MSNILRLDKQDPPHSRQRRRASAFFREFGFGYFLLAPVVLYIVVFQFYPLTETIRLSLYDYSLISGRGMSFNGFGNYKELLVNDEAFWRIFWNSIIWVLGSTALQFAIAIPAAIILFSKIRFRGLWRGLMMVPWVSPVVIIGIVWKWIYDGHYGLFNHYLKMVHLISENIVWLGDEQLVWPALLLTSAWKGFPYITLMMLSGLTGISREMIEAAHMDGASAWQRFTRITLPMLKPIMYVTGLVSIVSSWTKFEMIWALTNGGPGYATSILPTYLYTNSFVYFDLGKGSAIATLSMAMVLILVGIYSRLFGRNQE